MAGPTHQIISGFGIRWEVLCGVVDWEHAAQSLRRAKDPCPNCLALLELEPQLPNLNASGEIR